VAGRVDDGKNEGPDVTAPIMKTKISTQATRTATEKPLTGSTTTDGNDRGEMTARRRPPYIPKAGSQPSQATSQASAHTQRQAIRPVANVVNTHNPLINVKHCLGRKPVASRKPRTV
jgi:hypothetical protein